MDEEDAMASGQLCPRMEGQAMTIEIGEILAVRRGEVHSVSVVRDEPAVSLDGLTGS
jgi:quercetin dioxygenase-like cupin family protein